MRCRSEKCQLGERDLEGIMVSPEALAQAKSLRGATMPDGARHP
jgi:hypothetical protein